MIKTQPFSFKDFTGGIIDDYLDSKPNTLAKFENWILDSNNNPNQRPGFFFLLHKTLAFTAQVKANVTGVSFASGSPGVVSATAHGYQNQDAVSFSGGTLPAEVVAGTIYYVTNKATDSFEIALTPGGSSINFSGSGSGATLHSRSRMTCSAATGFGSNNLVQTGFALSFQSNSLYFVRLPNPDPNFTSFCLSRDPGGRVETFSVSPGTNVTIYPHTQERDSVAPTDYCTNLVSYKNSAQLLQFRGRHALYPYQDGWAELLGPTSQTLFGSYTAGDLLTATQWKDHVLVTTEELEYPQKLFYDSGSWKLRAAGLPAIPTDPTITPTAGADTYIYAFIYEYTYTVNGVTFTDQSAVRTVEVTSATFPITVDPLNGSGGANEITNTGLNRNFDVTNIKMKTYRTTANGTIYYYLGASTDRTNGTGGNFADSLADSTLQDNEILYISQGEIDNDRPPRAKYAHVTKNTGWYLNLYGNPYGIAQSVPDDIDSVPETFYDNLEEEGLGISSVNSNPIAFGRNHVYRIDGLFDKFGNGGFEIRRISDRAGLTNQNAIIQTIAGLFWAGNDGFYFTDGFNAIKLSKHLNVTYKKFVLNETRRRLIQGVYDRSRQLCMWLVCNRSEEDDNTIDTVVVLDLRQGLTEESCFFTFASGDPSTTYHFGPQFMAFHQNQVIFGDKHGFVMEFKDDYLVDPSYPSNLSTAAHLWSFRPVFYDMRTFATSFSQTGVRKWVPKATFNFQNTGNLSLQPYTINDDGRFVGNLQAIRRRTMVWGEEEIFWSEESLVWGDDGTGNYKRHFPKGGLRCSYKQTGLKNGYVLITDSVTLDTLVTVNSSTKQATFEGADPPNWPRYSVGYKIAFSSDNYTTEFEITAKSGNTITFSDPGSQAQMGANISWRLFGYPKGERVILESFDVHAGMLSSSQEPFGGAQETGIDG